MLNSSCIPKKNPVWWKWIPITIYLTCSFRVSSFSKLSLIPTQAIITFKPLLNQIIVNSKPNNCLFFFLQHIHPSIIWFPNTSPITKNQNYKNSSLRMHRHQLAAWRIIHWSLWSIRCFDFPTHSQEKQTPLLLQNHSFPTPLILWEENRTES